MLSPGHAQFQENRGRLRQNHTFCLPPGGGISYNCEHVWSLRRSRRDMHYFKKIEDVSDRIVLFACLQERGVSYNCEHVWSLRRSRRDMHNFKKIEDLSDRITLFACLQDWGSYIDVNMFGLFGALEGTCTISRTSTTSQTESYFLLASRRGDIIKM